MTALTTLQEPVIEHHVNSNGYFAFLSGILMSTWSLMGYDASAHMIEETISADEAARWSFLLSTGLAFVCGFLYLLGLCIGIKVNAFASILHDPALAKRVCVSSSYTDLVTAFYTFSACAVVLRYLLPRRSCMTLL